MSLITSLAKQLNIPTFSKQPSFEEAKNLASQVINTMAAARGLDKQIDTFVRKDKPFNLIAAASESIVLFLPFTS